jgi:hypothetical protein
MSLPPFSPDPGWTALAGHPSMPEGGGGRDVFVLWIVGYLERRHYAKLSSGILVLRHDKFNTYLQNRMCFLPRRLAA